ncbi:ATP-dependent Clp protease adapter ClpS [bacterium]|nr:ATP-dependent Clp protease adapter ClpS [bacterium]
MHDEYHFTDTGSSEGGIETISDIRTRLKKPRLYKVLLLNDDYTTMDFVVMILEGIFLKSPTEAARIMLEVHHKGSGLCGIYPKEIAEAKIVAVEARAREEEFPLRCVMEEE